MYCSCLLGNWLILSHEKEEILIVGSGIPPVSVRVDHESPSIDVSS